MTAVSSMQPSRGAFNNTQTLGYANAVFNLTMMWELGRAEGKEHGKPEALR